MVDAARLKSPARRRWLGLVLLVLLAHLAAIQWIGDRLQPLDILPKLAAPMFTRLLQQQAPPEPVAVARVAAPAAPAKPQVRMVAPHPPAPATPPAHAASAPTTPERPDTAPAQSAEPAASPAAPAAAASAAGPAPAASAPVTPTQVAAAAVTPSSAPVSSASAPQPAASASERAASEPAIAAAPAAAASATRVPSGPGLGPDGWPVDTRLNYRLGGNYRGALHGSAHVQWLRQAQRYETKIDIDITLLASLTMTSQGTVTPQGLRPEVYEELRRSGVRRAELKGDSVVLGNGKVLPRPEGVQDAASQFVELAHRFATGEDRLEVGRTISMWLARPGGVDRWTYDVVGRETLSTPELGPVDTFHLKPRPLDRPRGNITAEIWFAPTLQYLPVRIRIDMDGQDTYLDLVVLNIQQR